ncbi:MarR family winged helix-turn-helix transcriptional regulator [Nocardia sp. CY41]|uniref:MarR family winged helix-turn-helix transcriptional regulator n=1 Tax=Nocardia sp. CY41 TaxID=2608686 RepID=UPI00135A9480|nr:MarR family transcriptional regulator [Nocardia sp. CY41]
MRRAEELRYLILAAQREGNRMLGQALRPLGLTPSQAEVVRVLHERQPLTLNGLGDLLVCESGNSPSRLVDRLATAGIVRRQPSEYDRRHIELSLTVEGARLAALITEIEEHLYESIDHASDRYDTDQITGFLWSFVGSTPAGQALARRATTSPKAHPDT